MGRLRLAVLPLVALLLMGATNNCGGSQDSSTGHHDVAIAKAAYAAGFRGTALTTAVAISFAESDGTDEDSTNTDRWHSVDRGWWQINNHWHPEVSNACAHSLNCAARATYRISRHGRDFSPWTTYGSGAWRSRRSRALHALSKI